jgi:hypothetical protein
MRRMKSEETRRAEFETAAGGMYVRLRQWRAAHPEASFDEIGEQVRQERKALMAQLLGELAVQPEEAGVGQEVCAGCGQAMRPKGKRKRGVSHLEGEVRLAREYLYCEECQRGFFPPGRQVGIGGARVEPADG